MKTAPEKFITVSAKSAATGRPHYFGRLYEDTDRCIWCGNGREHEWHLDAPPSPLLAWGLTEPCRETGLDDGRTVCINERHFHRAG